jgi:hypothetical protein
MKIIGSSKEHTHKFFTIAPGLGKTKLILCNAIDLALKQKSPVIILNENEILSDRDFMQAVPFLDELNISSANKIDE